MRAQIIAHKVRTFQVRQMSGGGNCKEAARRAQARGARELRGVFRILVARDEEGRRAEARKRGPERRLPSDGQRAQRGGAIRGGTARSARLQRAQQAGPLPQRCEKGLPVPVANKRFQPAPFQVVGQPVIVARAVCAIESGFETGRRGDYRE